MVLRGLAVFLYFLIFSESVFAYPELSRHGYTNCTACHLSPSGGGLLTPYGRELSKETLSTWAKDGEQSFAYGKLSHDEKVLLGAYIRGVQVHREDQNRKEGRAILMQADAEAGYNSEKWAIAASLGRQEIRSGLESDSRIFSRRHYFLYRPSDTITLRAGKFLRFFGLNDPNHNLYVRKDLGFGFDTETYNLEASYLGDNWSIYLTYLDGDLTGDRYAYLKEKAGTLSVSYFLADKHKLGLSLYRGEDSIKRRWLGGPWLIFSFFPQMFLMSEFDWQAKELKSNQTTQRGYVTSNRLNYEWFQGFISFLSFDKKYLDSNDPNTEQEAYGLGIQFFPRPHFELVTSWQKEEVIATKSKSDLLWLMIHFYL